MTLLPRSLTGRLLATAALFIMLALVATGVAVQFALHRFVQGQIDQRLDGQIMTIEAALESQPDGVIALGRNVDAPPFDNPRTGWFWLARTADRSWHSRGPVPPDLNLGPEPGPTGRPGPLAARGVGGRPVRMRVHVAEIGGQAVTVAAAAPIEALYGPLRDALVPLVTALLVLGASLILATVLQVRTGLRPLRDLQRRLAEVRTGQIERLPTLQPDEVRPLVAEMNSLLDQNAANLERARRHVANLAHGLKTPLAALTLALQEPARDPDRSLRGLTLTMDRRIRHHLARARAAALGVAARRTLPLAARIADHAAAFAKIYADKKVRIDIAVAAEITVACDAQDLDEMIGNLLDNAFKWCGGAVRVAAEPRDKVIELIVEDDGPGVLPERLQDILRPGQRLDESVPGDGFGLAIVSELAELYGGGVSLARSPLGGLRAALLLPSAGWDGTHRGSGPLGRVATTAS